MLSIVNIISDHFVIHITISINNVRVPTRSISYRNTSSINVSDFISNLRSSICINNVCASTLNNYVLYALNMLAPIKKIVRMGKVHWFNDNTLLSKKYIRQQERLFKKHRNTYTLNQLLTAKSIFRRKDNISEKNY